MALILDTGPLYASLDRSDRAYAACRRLIETASEPLVIPSPELVEVDYWIDERLHVGVLVVLLDDIAAGAYQVEDLGADDYRRVCELADLYADADLGFVDAAVSPWWRDSGGETRYPRRVSLSSSAAPPCGCASAAAGGRVRARSRCGRRCSSRRQESVVRGSPS